MSPRQKAAASRYTTRDKLIAAGASAAVVVVTLLLILVLKPGDSGPAVTNVPSSVPQLQGDPTGADPGLTVPSLPTPGETGTTPAPSSPGSTGPPAS